MGNNFTSSFKRTKIVATLGPATGTEEKIEELITHGMNIARLNFSHGTHADHTQRIANIRNIEKKLETHVAIMQDLQGPKIRLGDLREESRVLTRGEEITLTHGDTQEDEKIPVQYNIFPYVEKGHILFVNDGIIKLQVLSHTEKSAVCTVLAGGEIKSHKGVNLPDTIIPSASLTEKDKKDLQLGLSEKVDYVAISFVQTSDDVVNLKKIISKSTHQPRVIVKIETKSAIKHLDEIIQAADAVMVARGDLAVEVGQEEVPLLQRTIIRLARKYDKPVIVATQMLESMIHNVEPTRAEVNDVATAVIDEVDAVMLSAETAAGEYPIETVTMMNKIIRHVERVFDKGSHELDQRHVIDDTKDQTMAIAAATSLLAHQLQAKIIFTLTASGKTAQKISSYRPYAPIIVVTDNKVVAQQLCLVWGVASYYLSKINNNEKAFAEIVKKLQEMGELKKEDRIVLVTGTHPGESGHTNVINVTTAGEI